MITSIQTAIITALTAVVGLLLGLVATYHTVPPLSFGSVAQTSEYNATTTSTYSPFPSITLLTSSTTRQTGTFGSFIQTAAGSSGAINVYDATTTNVNLRLGNVPTSTILMASLPIAAAAGTYTYDAVFKTGLLVVVEGTAGTTTMTWR